MDKFGVKIESIRPIINYTKENMINEDVFREVKDMARERKEYMK